MGRKENLLSHGKVGSHDGPTGHGLIEKRNLEEMYFEDPKYLPKNWLSMWTGNDPLRWVIQTCDT